MAARARSRGAGEGGRPTCFLHIPKSGGMSIQAALSRALGEGAVAPQRFDASVFCGFGDFHLLPAETRREIVLTGDEALSLGRYPAVAGHFSLPTLLQVADAGSIATVVREPRARLLSLYAYWRVPGIGERWDPYRADLQALGPLERFLSEPLLAPMIDNQVARMLLFGDPRLAPDCFVAERDVEAIAAEAIEQLDRLGFVGSLELGDSCWEGIGRLFGVRLEPTVVNETGAGLPPAPIGDEERLLSEEALELLALRTRVDDRLYDHVLARAGLGIQARGRLTENLFASQLVRLTDLVGHSAAAAAEQAGALAGLRGELQESRLELERTAGVQAELDGARASVAWLRGEVERLDGESEKLRRWLDAVHRSASWRSTAPLRAIKRGLIQAGSLASADAQDGDRSTLAGRSSRELWQLALGVATLIALADVALVHVTLIGLLPVASVVGALSGRRTGTLLVGLWTFALAVVLSVPDRIWDSHSQLIYLAVVAGAGLLATSAAGIAEHRRRALR